MFSTKENIVESGLICSQINKVKITYLLILFFFTQSGKVGNDRTIQTLHHRTISYDCESDLMLTSKSLPCGLSVYGDKPKTCNVMPDGNHFSPYLNNRLSLPIID